MSGTSSRRYTAASRRAPRACASPDLPEHRHLSAPTRDLGADSLWDCVIADSVHSVDLGEGPARMQGAEIRQSRLDGVRLVGARAPGLRISDSHLVGCDLSGMFADGAVLNRVRLTECRLTGLVLSGARLVDVTIEDCHADMLDLRMARIDRLRLVGTRARQADLTEVRASDIATDGSDLTGADLSRATFSTCDLRGSVLDDMRGASALRGSTIAPEQVLGVGLSLIAEAGIRVD